MYLNKTFLLGNLTRDPELRALPSGIQVASFGLATNRVYKDKDGAKKESVDFHNIVIFGKQGELCAQYLKKGQTVLVEGRIQTRSWDDKDGQKKYRTEIIADRVQFGPKSSGGGGYDRGGKTADKDAGPKEEAGGGVNYPAEEISPDDIPF